MSSYVELKAIVEGKTEELFINNILNPYLSQKNIGMIPIQVSKPGQKGGDVKFARVINDIRLHLKQRKDTYLTLFLDYYAIDIQWPGLEEAKKQSLPEHKAEQINRATKDKVNQLFKNQDSDRRFIPYISMHEFEALLFSDPEILANQLQVRQSEIDKILHECGRPEEIDDSPDSAPSRRIENLSSRFKKTSTGITIAKTTGIEKMREQCPIFNQWLTQIESINC